MLTLSSIFQPLKLPSPPPLPQRDSWLAERKEQVLRATTRQEERLQTRHLPHSARASSPTFFCLFGLGSFKFLTNWFPFCFFKKQGSLTKAGIQPTLLPSYSVDPSSLNSQYSFCLWQSILNPFQGGECEANGVLLLERSPMFNHHH